MSARRAKSVKVSSASVESVWVRWSYGTVSSVRLMSTDGVMWELRGAPMWRWLREWSPQSGTVPRVHSSAQMSLPFGKANGILAGRPSTAP